MRDDAQGITFPPPAGLSDEAVRSLQKGRPDIQLPEVDDYTGWQKLVEVRNAGARARLSEVRKEPPSESTEREVDGVHTYVVRAAGARDSKAVQLYFHGGALIFGSGEMCRFEASFAAANSGLETHAVDYRMPPERPYPAVSTTRSPSTAVSSTSTSRATLWSAVRRPVGTSPRRYWCGRTTRACRCPPPLCCSLPRSTSPSPATPSGRWPGSTNSHRR